MKELTEGGALDSSHQSCDRVMLLVDRSGGQLVSQSLSGTVQPTSTYSKSSGSGTLNTPPVAEVLVQAVEWIKIVSFNGGKTLELRDALHFGKLVNHRDCAVNVGEWSTILPQELGALEPPGLAQGLCAGASGGKIGWVYVRGNKSPSTTSDTLFDERHTSCYIAREASLVVVEIAKYHHTIRVKTHLVRLASQLSINVVGSTGGLYCSAQLQAGYGGGSPRSNLAICVNEGNVNASFRVDASDVHHVTDGFLRSIGKDVKGLSASLSKVVRNETPWYW
jgi:hypothetical protein